MAYPCVPFNATFAGGKLDIRAIYKRPNGDLMTLPMRRHYQWEAKGFAYVTIADHDSLMAIRAYLPNAKQYVVGLDGDGRETPWDVALYLADRKEVQAKEDAELAALVAEHGAEMVEKIKGVKVPAHLKADKPKARAGASA